MPELADVEGFRRVLCEHAVGHRIVDVEVRDAGVLRGTGPGELRGALRGRRFGEPWRHGKWLIAPAGGPALALHFGMTGALLADLGPDAATLGRAGLGRLLTGRRGRLKAALMDQGVVAGLGNLLVDEILWRARLHPTRRCAELTSAEVSGLHRRMRSVLASAARAGRVPPYRSWLTGHRDEPGGRCPRCGTELAHGRVGGRTSVWCPHCQPAP